MSAPLPFTPGSAEAWRDQHGLLGTPAAVAAAVAGLPPAPVARFTARTPFDGFTEMERMASPEEAAGLLTSIANRGRNFTSNQSLQVMVNLPSTLPFVVDLP